MTLTYSEIMVRYGELSTKGKNRMRFINKLLSLIHIFKLMAPHGGIFVIALTSNALLFLLFILIGAVVSGILFGFLRKPLDK